MPDRSQTANPARPVTSQRERAYQELRARLIKLELEPGAALDVPGLMRELSLGRTPLIEAMQQLAREDLLDIHPRQGTVVTQPGLAQARHILELRDGYEGRVARLAARRRSAGDLRAIREIEARLHTHAAEDGLPTLLDDYALHLRIAQAAGNPLLLQSLDHLLALNTRLLMLVAKTERLPDHAYFSHAGLIEAIAAGDPDAAETAALEHVRSTNEILLRFFNLNEAYRLLPNEPVAPEREPSFYPAPGGSGGRAVIEPNPAGRREFMRAATFAAGLSGLAHVSMAGVIDAAPPRGGRVETALLGEPDTLDPHRTRFAVSSAVFSGIYEPLVAKDDNLHYEGILAESWEISDDGTEYLFRLRPEIVFHDGTPFDTESVVFTLDRLLAESSFAFLLEPIVRIEVIDRLTVKLVLSEPVSPLLDILSAPFLGMLPPPATRSGGDRFGRNPIGTGPWMLREWVAGEKIVLEPNPRYRNFHSRSANRGAPLLDELVLRFVPYAAQLAEFEAGRLNVIALVPEDIERIKDRPEYRLHTTDGGTIICYLDFAMLPPTADSGARFRAPFDDRRVREALGVGIDLDTIVERIMPGIGVRTRGPLPTATFAYRPEIAEYGYRFDPERAKALLTEAGWIDTDGDGVRERDGAPLELLLGTFKDDTIVRLAEEIRRGAAEIGVRIRIETYEAGAYIAWVANGGADLHLDTYGWPDPDMLYLMTTSDYGIGFYRDEAFRSLVIAARQTHDLAHRTELYFEASKRLLADAAMIPIATYIGTVATHNNVQNFKLGPQGIFVLEDAYVTE